MPVARADLKQWAREHMVGVENCTFPSFTADMAALDEEAIRHDVRQAIAHGFFSTMCSTETGLSFEEAKRFVEIVADEGKGRISVSTAILFDTMAQNREFLVHAEAAGCDTALLGYAPSYYPTSEEQIECVTREMCELTDLGIVLYPSPHYNFGRFHHSGFNPKLIEGLAGIDSVVAIKVGEPGLAAECAKRVGEQILVNCPVERWLPLCWLTFGQQWIGAGCYEVFQSPQKPYLVQYFDLLRSGRWDEAMDIYWMLTPLRVMFEQQFNQTVMSGTYHWPLQKYYQYLSGGNGGYTRQPCMKVHQFEMDPLRFSMRMVGLNPEESDEAFYYGRMSFARMQASGAAASASAEARPAAEPASLSSLTLPNADDEPVAMTQFKGNVLVLYGGAQGATEDVKAWQAALEQAAATRADLSVLQLALLGGLPAFVPKDMVKASMREGPAMVLDWDGTAQRLLGVSDPNTAHVFLVDKDLTVAATFTGACTDSAVAALTARIDMLP